MGDVRANRILLAVTAAIGIVVGTLGWMVVTYRRGPNACRAHGGARMGVRAPGPGPDRVVCVDGTIVTLRRRAALGGLARHEVLPDAGRC